MDGISQEVVHETGVGEETGSVGVDTGAQDTQVTESSTEAEPAGSGEPAISIDENGELNIGDELLAEAGAPAEVEQKVEKPAPVEEVKAPEVYTPEDMAKAFIENTIDASKLPESVQNYYKAILAEQQRRTEILSINRPQPAQPVTPVAPPQAPQPAKALTPAQYAELQGAGKTLATRMLGIKPDEFDEYNPNHQQAQQIAMNDIRVRAQQIEQERAQQAYQAQAQAYQQQQVAIRQQNLQSITTEFQKNANWQDIDQNFYPTWRSKLDAQTGAVVDSIMAEGNVDKVKALMSQVIKAYDAQKTPNMAVKQVQAPPAVMGSNTSTDVVENKGMADTSKLGGMTPEERAAWFIQNKFV